MGFLDTDNPRTDFIKFAKYKLEIKIEPFGIVAFIFQILFIKFIKFSLIVITETWLHEFNTKLYNIPNYKVIHITCESSILNNKNIGGGVSIFFQDDIHFEKIEKLCFTRSNFFRYNNYFNKF